jgi:hypothetical protein
MNADDFQTYVGKRTKVVIERVFAGEPRHNGFVLGVSDTLVLVQQFHDFYCEGYTAIRLADVESVRSGEHERLWERMMTGEGIMETVGIQDPPSIADMSQLLASLAERGRNISVECESLEDPDEDDFLIGRITDLDVGKVVLRDFDALGNWGAELEEIALDAITKVQFDTPYINTFSKYLR